MNKIPDIFDRKAIAKKLLPLADKPIDFITQIVVDDLVQRLRTISRTFDHAALLAPDITRLPNRFQSALGAINPVKISTLLKHGSPLFCDPENLSLPAKNYNLIISLFDMGVINDVPGFLSRIQRHLAPDGLFFAAFIGGTSLSELRSAWLEADTLHLGGAVARIAPFIDIKDAGSLLQRAKFALPVTDKETLNLRYASPIALMAELKALGASNPLISNAPGPVTKSHLESASEFYVKAASDQDKRVRATIEIVWMSGWAPHKSQQKPLKPGSAQISLTKILKTK